MSITGHHSPKEPKASDLSPCRICGKDTPNYVLEDYSVCLDCYTLAKAERRLDLLSKAHRRIGDAVALLRDAYVGLVDASSDINDVIELGTATQGVEMMQRKVGDAVRQAQEEVLRLEGS